MNYPHNPTTEQEAIRRGKELADYLNKKFNIDKWSYRHHFNSWWCYNATLGSISVSCHELGEFHKDHIGTYSTLISDEKDRPYFGAGFWTGKTTHMLPEESVKIAINNMKDSFNKIKDAVEDNLTLLNLK